MTGSIGLQRFVRGSGPPAAATAPPGGQAEATHPQPDRPGATAAAQPLAGHPGQPGTATAAAEKCEMCATPVPAEHGHVADLEQATLLCACRACYLLFTQEQAGRGRYRAVPDRYLADPASEMSVAEWDELEIPVGLAFFLHSSQRGEVAGFYPSPAGATECRLDLKAWQRLAAAHPLLDAAAVDVEAILISRNDSGVECFLVPIDACYELAGRMRLHWRGFDGGSEARASIAEFLGTVRSRARAFRRGS